MSYPSYPEYKSTQIPWLAEIPSHWSVDKFRYVFKESQEVIHNRVVGEMLSVSGYRGIETKIYDDENIKRTKEELFGYRVVRKGQLVVNTMWLNYAGLGVSALEGHVSPAYRSYWIEGDVDKRFIHHLMRSSIYVQGYTQLLTGIRPNSLQMSRDNLLSFPVILPPRTEQTQIARFLDHQTARIDALIAEQQRLIELLKEKRQAVISHAVTKGLDPDVAMKDSGVEWLGEVPEHWDILKLGYIATDKCDGPFGSAIKSEHYSDSGVRVIRLQNIRRAHFSGEDAAYLDLDYFQRNIGKSEVKEGDVLIAGLGDENNPVGRACVAPPGIEPAMVKADCFRFRLDKNKAAPEFIAFQLSSGALFDGGTLATGSTRSRIPLLTMATRIVALPPLQEQRKITYEVKNLESGIDQLLVKTQYSLDLLLERRSAIISAAVTGKIDVRDWEPPNSETFPEASIGEGVTA